MAFWVPLLAALGGAIIGSSVSKKREPEVVTQPALHPEQEEVMKELTPIYETDNS